MPEKTPPTGPTTLIAANGTPVIAELMAPATPSTSSSHRASVLPSDPRFGTSHAWLLRLFKSDFFDEWMAIHYLFLYAAHDGIQHYLCEELRKFNVASVQEYLPQLCHILVINPGMTHLESLIVNRCRISTHFALLTLWYFQSYLADLEEFGESLAHIMCARVIATVERIIHARDDTDDEAEPEPDSSSPDDAAAPVPAVAPAATGPVVSATGSVPSTSAASPPTSPRAMSRSVSQGGPHGPAGLASLRMPSASPSLEDLHKGKAFSFSHFVSRVAASSSAGSPSGSGTASKRSSVSSTHSASRPNSSPDSPLPPGSGAQTPHRRASITSILNAEAMVAQDPKLLEQYYFHSELQFMAALVAISERLVPVPREARQSTLTAELTLLNHNFPAPVCIPLWCQATGARRHHQIVRISPVDAVVLNSADRVPFLLFIEVIEDDDECTPDCDHDESVVHTEPTAKRGIVRRRSSLSLLSTPPAGGSNADLAAAPVSPGGIRKSPSTPAILDPATPTPPPANPAAGPVIPGAATLIPGFIPHHEFEDRMRTAAIMLAQLAVQEQAAHGGADDAAAARRGARRGSRKRRAGNAPKLTEEIRSRILKEMMALEERRVAALREWHAAEAAARASAGYMADHDDGDGGEAGTREAEVNGTRAAAAAVPANGSRRDSTATNGSSATTVERRQRQGSMPVVGTGSSNGGAAGAALVMDKEDPSSAVVRETWARKRHRIRASSTFGQHAKWNLLSVIVKTGADLRQEQLACQLIREMARVWTGAEAGCWVYPFRVLVTGQSHGIIETVRNTISIHSLKKDAYARVGDHFTLKHFFVAEFGPESSPAYARAVECFTESLAGYSIMSYVLNLKDRHNGNILLDYTTGHLVHIDFGFMLSNSPGAVGFESAPFKLAHEYVELLDGFGSPRFRDWRNRMVQGFLALRRHHERVVGLVEIMERSSPLDCFSYTSLQAVASASSSSAGSNASSPVPPPPPPASSAAAPSSNGGNTALAAPAPLPVAAALRDRLLLSLTDAQVADFVDRLIASSMGNVFTRLYDGFQYYTQGVMA
ncbi:Phosphatidylinositol 4-kinase pik1alpha (PI4-kinase)(PtdIns-4-kinase) [Blastocladiella emersonii ATCC 22665]|nr:Phosphatidylinositol 4-kinase pik1alpha (PI4-kinase)(PtdIns-4-kinase) [Blastocladiella emersonii ATCC 22665]